MTIFTIKIDAPASAMQRRSMEAGYIAQAVALAMAEFGRTHGTVTSGEIIGQSNDGVPNSSLGSWRYEPVAKES